MQNFEAQFARAVIAHRWWIIVASLCLVAAMASGGRLLWFSADYLIMFDEDNPERLAHEHIEDTFTKTDNFLLVVAPHSGDVFSREVLRIVVDLTDEAWQIPQSTRVDSISNYQHTEAEEDDLVVRDLVADPENLTAGQIAAAKAVALGEPLLVRRLISVAGDVTGINIRLSLDDEQKDAQTIQSFAYVEEMLEGYRQRYPTADFYLSGEMTLSASIPLAAQRDGQELLPLSFILMAVVLMVLLRSFMGTFAVLLVVGFSIISAVGLRGYSGYPLSPNSGAMPIVILTVAVANCVHLLVTFIHGLQAHEPKLAALEDSLRVNFQPIAIASLTTAVGFLTLNASSVPAARWLGNTVACGVVVSLLLSLTFLPAVLSLLPIRPAGTGRSSDVAMRRLGDFVVARRTPLLYGMSVVIITLISFVSLNEANEDPYEWFDETFEMRRSADFVEANLTGTNVLNYALAAGGEGAISQPQFLAEVGKFTGWLRTQPEVRHVASLTDIMKRLNKNLNGDDPAAYRLPEERELSAQYLLLYEMSLPYGLDLNDQLNIDKSSIRLAVTTRRVTLQEITKFESRVQNWLANNAPAINSGGGSGVNYMFAVNNIRNTKSMVGATSLALVLISLLLIAAFRSVKYGVISLVPNLVPAAMGFGVWGIIDGWISIEIAPVMGMTLGIVVDDTVHFMSKYLRARRENGLASSQAVVYAFSTVGQALIITTIVLLIGFLTLTTSHFGMTSRMAGLTAIVIVAALAVDFFFLPPLLMKVEGNEEVK
jgi:predicted RND superfamily exporter protein